ncbi:MAG: hypothetical protein A2511_17505 [Deltaproteobacteria bacterium RIFOXYD12_FULL_50_9]|nr:MAG: hypothetical protein A2511_17505 [Deltaproteobacteria bacterium RIFOXYD12_FULL_50_9]
MTAPLLPAESLFDVLVINRERDKARLERFAATCAAKELVYQRIDAVDALTPSFQIEEYLQYVKKGQGMFHAQIPLGSFGNWMSQIKAWRYVVKSNKPALICEDDSDFIGKIEDLNGIFEEDLKWDLVFCNDRACPATTSLSKEWIDCCQQWRSVTVPLSFAINTRLALQKPWTAPGGDCYMISPAGAERLLKGAEKTGVYMHLDWMLVRHSIFGMRKEDFLYGNPAQPFYRFLKKSGSVDLSINLKARTLIRPFARHRPQGVGGSITKNPTARSMFYDVKKGIVITNKSVNPENDL